MFITHLLGHLLMNTIKIKNSRVITCTITDEQYKYLLKLALLHDYNLSAGLRYLINKNMKEEEK